MRRVFRNLAEYTRSMQPLMDNGVRYSRCALLDACIKYPIRFSFYPDFSPLLLDPIFSRCITDKRLDSQRTRRMSDIDILVMDVSGGILT